ncbi:MAG: hypothetical protein U0L20_01460 [Ruminococcus sp.]|nr:hypothetical protein [Ruminococcus sp.]
MDFEKYKTELELIHKQNDVEHDLYNIIANVVRERKAFNNISLRDIGNRRRTKSGKEKVFWGLRGFPDFVILDEKYEPIEQSVDRQYVYGVIEAKFAYKPLFDNYEDKRQLLGHLLWFKKVIYTNGIEWRFYSVDENKVNSMLEQATSKKLEELQNNSYTNLAKKEIVYNEIDCILDTICKKNIIDELMICEPIVLRTKNDSGEIIWNKVKWDELINFLDKYKF